MKIGLETQCLTKTIRGIGVYTLTLLQTLQEKQKAVECFSFSSKGWPFENSIRSLFRPRCFEGADLIHFPEPKILYGKRPSIPIVLTVHDVMPLLFPNFFPRKSYIMMKIFLARYVKEADGIICPSEQTKRDLLEFFSIASKKTYVIPLAITEKKRTIQKEKEPFLLYVGSFEPRKNVERIVHAFANIRKEGFPHRLILAGKEEGSHVIPRDLIEKLGLKSEIDIIGYISDEKKADLFQKAALLLWPSLYEGFGLPLLEAMASGTPIVTTRGLAMEEVVADASVLVDPLDPEDIAQGAISILSDQDKSDTLISKGLVRSKDFSRELFATRHLQLYSSIVKCS